MSKPHYLILGAFAPELSPVREVFGKDPNISIQEIGIGTVEAAMGTTIAIAQISREETCSLDDLSVIFVGSVGAVKKSTPLFTLVSAELVKFCDIGAATNHGYFPASQPLEFFAEVPDEALIREVLGDTCTIARIYSTPSITSNREAANALCKRTGCYFENLELFGVASACERFGIPWTSFSCVTNTIGPEGHEEWKKKHQKAADMTAVRLNAYLRALT